MTPRESNDLIAGQCRLEGKIETLTARFDAHNDRLSNETKTLFASRREHGQQIQSIQLDYTPKKEFQKHKQENSEEHKAMLAAINCTQWKLGKIMGAIVLFAFLSGLVVEWAGRLGR